MTDPIDPKAPPDPSTPDDDDDDDALDTPDELPPDHDHDLATVAPAPEAVGQLAAACVRFVTTKYGVPLDFTSDTLSLVDQYVRDAREDIETKPETIDLVQASIGAYLGEVMRRAFGARWFCTGDYEGWRLDFTYVYLTFNPIGMAREALTLQDEGWHAHLTMDEAEKEAVEARLEALPQADEETFYAPSTRYDVVEIAVAALRAKMAEDGVGDVRFGEEDYTR